MRKRNETEEEKKTLLKRKLPYIRTYTLTHTYIHVHVTRYILSIIFVFILDICQFDTLAILHVYIIYIHLGLYIQYLSMDFIWAHFHFHWIGFSPVSISLSQNWHLFWFLGQFSFRSQEKNILLLECVVVSLTIFLFNCFWNWFNAFF